MGEKIRAKKSKVGGRKKNSCADRRIGPKTGKREKAKKIQESLKGEPMLALRTQEREHNQPVVGGRSK